MTCEDQYSNICGKGPARLTPGRIAYDAYCAKTGWKSAVTGEPLPIFPLAKPEVKEAWEAAGEAVKAFYKGN
jgi:hypothetical protein